MARKSNRHTIPARELLRLAHVKGIGLRSLRDEPELHAMLHEKSAFS